MLQPFHDKTEELAFIYAHCGLKPDQGTRVYSVAAAVIDTRCSKKEFESLVRYSRMTGREKYYSNISKDMVRKAPHYTAVRDDLRHFLKTRKFVFTLDDHHTYDDIEHICGDIRIIDLSFAAEFFLPHSEFQTPKRLWEYLSGKQRDKFSFTAKEAVDLSVELVRYICGNILNDHIHPRAAALRYYLKKSNTLFGEIFLHITKNYNAYFGGLFDPYTETDTKNWKQFLEISVKSRRKKGRKAPYKKISPEKLERLYHGMAHADKGYVFRPGQIEYARDVAAALNDAAILTIEAGTGTGKTQGYLVPVMEFLHRNKDARVVVSTYTKSLQQQIFQREIAFTKSVFKHYRDIPAALLKGKSSYICAEKLDHIYDPGLEGEKMLTWLYFVNLIFHFREADIETVGEKIRFYLNQDYFFYQTLNEISARDGCKPRHIRCPAQVVTAEAAAARLVVTNHHKLVLLDQDSVLSGMFRNYVIDEANHFERAVRSALGEEVSSYEIGEVLRNLEPRIRRILPRANPGVAREIGKSLQYMNDVRRLIRELKQSLMAMNPKSAAGQVNELQYDHPGFSENYIQELMNELRAGLLGIGNNLKFIEDEALCRMLKIQSRTLQGIKIAIEQLEDYAGYLRSIEESLTSEDKVTAYQYFSKNWTLTAQSVEVAELIRTHIYARKECVIYTAATLCHRGSFEGFSRIVGMDTPFVIEGQTVPREFRFTRFLSPFSKDAMEIIVPGKAVNAKFNNKELWLRSVCDILPELIAENRGRTLVLFSSYNDLKVISETVAESLSTFPLLIQQPGVSTVHLCDEFREIKESVLFGVDTFWYGVDFKGDTLTQVIITRIPYPTPADPIQNARKKLMEPKDFWERYYYDTEIKMKQGIGRLIRCDTDRGRVVILDSRYRVRNQV